MHDGGIKDPLIIRYPKLIRDKDGIRRQFSHVSDITPTVLEMLGLTKPDYVKGIPQKPLEGTSFQYTFSDEYAEEQKTVQYFEMYGNRAIYKDGWKAVVNHAFRENFEEDQWELYHVAEDYSEKYNVADQYPEKLKELQEEWLIQAAKYNVFPMFPKAFHATTEQGTKYRHLMKLPAKTYTYKNVFLPHDLSEDPGLGTRSHSVTVVLNRKNKDESGVLISKGDRFAGVSYVLDLPDGKSGTITLFINGEKTAESKIQKLYWASSYATSLKINRFTSVNDKDYEAPFIYKGEIEEILIDVKATQVDLETEKSKGANID